MAAGNNKTLINRKPDRGASKGFSLVLLLLIMLAGTALLGVAFHIQGSFENRSFMSQGDMEKKNYIDEAMEIGKIDLATIVSNDYYTSINELPQSYLRYEQEKNNNSNYKIESVDDLRLVVDDSGETWSRDPYERTGFDGEKVTIEIDLFDVIYVSDDIDEDRIDELKHILPPGFSGDFVEGITGTQSAIVKAPTEESGLSEINPSDEAANDGFGESDGSDGPTSVGLYMVRVTATGERGTTTVTEAVIARTKE